MYPQDYEGDAADDDDDDNNLPQFIPYNTPTNDNDDDVDKTKPR